MTSEEFKKLRKSLSLTQREMGERLQFGSPQPRISEIERGRTRISPRVAELCRMIKDEAVNAIPTGSQG